MGAEGWLGMDVGTQGVSTGEGKGREGQGRGWRGVVLRDGGSTSGGKCWCRERGRERVEGNKIGKGKRECWY